jgi:hypothetical protein
VLTVFRRILVAAVLSRLKLHGWWLPFVPAVVTFFWAAAPVVTSYLAITAAQIRTYFGRYLTDAVVRAYIRNSEGLGWEAIAAKCRF